jgi:arsenical pump membrane protein
LALALALVALGAALAAAVGRFRRLPESLVAAVGAALLVAVGAISIPAARHALGELAPTVGFLAALLVLADGCRREGVFSAVGSWLAIGSRGRPRALLGLTFAACTAVTVVLGLDAAVVLLTPVVFLTAARLRTGAKPYAYACAHLANSASLLLPVSNLTNLLAFRSSRLSFVHFGVLMALPWLAAIAVEWTGIRRFFAGALDRPVADDAPVAGESPPIPGESPPIPGESPPIPGESPPIPGESPPIPRFAIAVLALTLTGFALSSVVGIAPVWFAVAGAALITLRPGIAPRDVVRAAEPEFLVFVLALGVIVAAASDHGLNTAVRALLPSGASLVDLLAIAAVSAGLANVVNNLPATLILLPVTAALGTGPLLAMLVGVNVGPNLTYAGSLATLLWRRVLRTQAVDVDLAEFTRLGLLTVPAGIVLCTFLVWVSVRASA